MHPSVERGCPLFAASARLYAHRIRDFLNRVTEPDFFLNYKAREAYAMTLALNFTDRFLLFFDAHSLLNSIRYPRGIALASMNL
jgi:hypothetical protein